MIKKMNIFVILLTLFIYSCSSEEDSKITCPQIKLTANFSKDSQLYLLGNFNNWTLTNPMDYQKDHWETSLTLDVGNYGYLFYSKKNKKQYLDPNNQLTIYKDDIKSSRLIVEDCKYPKLTLDNL